MKTEKLKLRRIPEDIKKAKIEVTDKIKSTELKRQPKLIGSQNPKKFYKLGFGDRRKLKAKAEERYIITKLFNNGNLKNLLW